MISLNDPDVSQIWDSVATPTSYVYLHPACVASVQRIDKQAVERGDPFE